MAFSLNKKVKAQIVANKEEINSRIERQKGGGNLKPLVGHHELTVVDMRKFGYSNEHVSFSFTIAETPVRSDIVFWNLMTDEPASRTVQDFCVFMSLLDVKQDNDGGYDLSDDGKELAGKKVSGIIFARDKSHGYFNYSVVSVSRAGQSSSTKWLESQWNYNVLGIDRDGEIVNDNPFYKFGADIEGMKEVFMSTAYDAKPDTTKPEAKPKAKPQPSTTSTTSTIVTDDYDDYIPPF